MRLKLHHVNFATADVPAMDKFYRDVLDSLEEKGINYSDYGDWAMTGWKQVFFYDPDGNVVEVHQAPKDAP
jgi:catechol 2,3-dioxygenase-like lactoylglutathione lyase family enzyme